MQDKFGLNLKFWHYIGEQNINMLILLDILILPTRKRPPGGSKTMKLGQSVNMAVLDQVMIHPAELPGDFPDPIRVNRAFFHDGLLLR